MCLQTKSETWLVAHHEINNNRERAHGRVNKICEAVFLQLDIL